MENQCLGLAAALGVTPVIKRVKMRAPWRQLVPFLRLGLRWAFDGASGDRIEGPWPDIIIGCGRAGAAACLYARRAAAKAGGKRPYTVYIQNPVIDPSRFDLVAAPRHDGVLGENVVTTRGSMHRVTPEMLEREGERFKELLGDLPYPRVAVLIGGANAVYHFSHEDMERLAGQLAAMARKTGGSLMITPSRRTDAQSLAILKKAVADVPHFIWDGQGENPYYGMLDLADAVLVTADSVNMVSEACTTGKPVHVIPLEGGSEKFRRFHQALRDDGMTRPFTGELEQWSYQPLRDVQLVADRIKRILMAKGVWPEADT